MATHRVASYCAAGTCAAGISGIKIPALVELWLTPCVVTMPPPSSFPQEPQRRHDVGLLVPSNERLCGTQFSHFPVGGPTPHAHAIGERPLPLPSDDILGAGIRNKDEDDDVEAVSDRILYACETVDGTVTELVGPDLQAEIRKYLPNLSGDEQYPIRCPTGWRGGSAQLVH